MQQDEGETLVQQSEDVIVFLRFIEGSPRITSWMRRNYLPKWYNWPWIFSPQKCSRCVLNRPDHPLVNLNHPIFRQYIPIIYSRISTQISIYPGLYAHIHIYIYNSLFGFLNPLCLLVFKPCLLGIPHVFSQKKTHDLSGHGSFLGCVALGLDALQAGTVGVRRRASWCLMSVGGSKQLVYHFLMIYFWERWFGTWLLFFHILGMSSSQVTRFCLFHT